jgi:hypothetical protein
VSPTVDSPLHMKACCLPPPHPCVKSCTARCVAALTTAGPGAGAAPLPDRAARCRRRLAPRPGRGRAGLRRVRAP